MATQSEIGFKLAGNSPLFSSLNQDVLTALVKEVPLVEFEADQIMLREGDPGEAMYIIKSGMARVFTTQGDQEVELAVLGPGACVGEVATLTGSVRTASVMTMEPSELYQFSKRQLDEIVEQYPKVKKRLEALVLGRAEDTIDKITRRFPQVAVDSEAESTRKK